MQAVGAGLRVVLVLVVAGTGTLAEIETATLAAAWGIPLVAEVVAIGFPRP